MSFAKHLILEMIPAARDRQKYGKATFTEAGRVADRIRLARELLGNAKSFKQLSGLKWEVLEIIAEELLLYVAHGGANLRKLERALNHPCPDADALTHSKILDAYEDATKKYLLPPTNVEVRGCFTKRNPNNRPPSPDVMRDIIRNTLHLPLANARPSGRPRGSRNLRIEK